MSFNNISYSFSKNNSNTTKFSNNNIDGYSFEQNINEELFIIKSKLKVQSDLKVESSTNINGLIFGYNLNGYSEHKSKHSNSHLKLSKNDSFLAIMNKENNISYTSKGILTKVCFVIKKEFIEKNIQDNMIKDLIFSSLEEKLCENLLFQRKINPYINLLLNDIYKHPFDGSLSNIYLQSRVLELVFLELESIVKDKKDFVKNIKLDDYDIEAIKNAKDILLTNIKNPPSIIELAKMVRVNDFKLKKGFKEVFQTTPYNLLLDYRLEYAKKLLSESDLSVGEIAQKVGYKYTASFSAAFIKKYGVTPKSIMKSKNYYY